MQQPATTHRGFKADPWTCPVSFLSDCLVLPGPRDRRSLTRQAPDGPSGGGEHWGAEKSSVTPLRPAPQVARSEHSAWSFPPSLASVARQLLRTGFPGPSCQGNTKSHWAGPGV